MSLHKRLTRNPYAQYRLSDYIAFMHVHVCTYLFSTLHVYDDLMAAWLVEMNSNIEMWAVCVNTEELGLERREVLSVQMKKLIVIVM